MKESMSATNTLAQRCSCHSGSRRRTKSAGIEIARAENAMAGLPLHNANLFPTVEGPALRLSAVNARTGCGNSKTRRAEG